MNESGIQLVTRLQSRCIDSKRKQPQLNKIIVELRLREDDSLSFVGIESDSNENWLK